MGSIIKYDTVRDLLREKIYAMEGRRVNFRLDKHRDPIVKGLVKHQIFAYHHFMENLFGEILIRELKRKSEELARKDINLRIELIPHFDPRLGREVYVKYSSTDPAREEESYPVDEQGRRLYPRRARIRRLSYTTKARVRFRAILERPPGSGEYVIRPDDLRNPKDSLRTRIGEIHVMVGSGYCSLRSRGGKLIDIYTYNDRRDPGGYIIHEGTDRAIIMKETSAHRVFIIAEPKEDKKEVEAVGSRIAGYNQVRKTRVKAVPSATGAYVKFSVVRPKFTATDELGRSETQQEFEVPILAIFEALLALKKAKELREAGEEVEPEDVEVSREDLYTFSLATIAPPIELEEKFDDLITNFRQTSKEEFRKKIREHSRNLAVHKLADERDRKLRSEPPTEEDIEAKTEEIFKANKKRFITDYVGRIFLQDFFPIQGYDDRDIYIAKAFVLGNVVRRMLLRILGIVPYDDRDHYRLKRTVSAGDLLGMVITEGVRAYIDPLYSNIADAVQKITSEYMLEIESGKSEESVKKSYRAKILNILNSELYTKSGDKINKFNEKVSNIIGTGKINNITGITEVIEFTNHYYLLALLRRIKVLMEKKRKAPEVRDLHPTQRGRMCPDETPDGLNIGIQKHMSLGAIFTQGLLRDERELLFLLLREIGMKSLKDSIDIDYYFSSVETIGKPPAQVLLDGEVIGTVVEAEKFVEEFRRIRRFGIKYLEKKYSKILKKLNEKVKALGKDSAIEIVQFLEAALKEVNIHYDEKENIVRIFSDAGRMRRPLFVVYKEEDIEILKKRLEGIRDGPREEAFVEKDGVYLPSDELISRIIEKSRSGELPGENARDFLHKIGIIDYLDAQEEESAYVALRPNEVTREHTHVEIHPSRIFGASASLLPFQEHNHSPRNIYGAGMAKQAIGLPYADFPIRVMSSTRILFYPQVPLVTTKGAELTGYHERPYGENMIVAIQVMEGYNMRDAIVLNASSVERGLARDYLLKRDHIVLVGDIKSTEAFTRYTQIGVVIPREKQIREDAYKIIHIGSKNTRRPHNFRKLGEDGVVEREVSIKRGEVVVGRTKPSRFAEKEPRKYVRDESEEMKEHFEMYVNDVFFFSSSGANQVIIRYRDHRPPSLGDKFSTRQGQKGVVGMLYKQEDLPYTSDGIVPDLVLNPHALPSRMTLGLLLEGLAGLVALKVGKPFDGTPFRFKDPNVLEEFRKKRFPDRSIEHISAFDILQKTLKELGFNPYGERTMYEGRTGRMLKTKIFVAPLLYRRLKHEVRDKMHMRARGKYQLLMRQPTEGKSRGGGLRVGEMERDTFVGHGATFVLLDRMLVNSDETVIYVCRNCGGIGYYKKRGDKEEPVCPFCKNPDLYPVKVSYPFYVLYTTLIALGIRPKIKLRSRFE